MRLIFRLLPMLVLVSYLLSHHGLFLRKNVWGLHSASGIGLLNGLPGKSQDDSRGEEATANLPPGVLPHHQLTPGAIDPRVTQGNIRNTICRRGYTASVRPPFKYSNAMKHRLMRIYGITASIHDYELDHLIPLELGGCPDCERNLWPQPKNVFPGANDKDEVERYLHDQVCSGEMPLAKAQREIAANWYAVYEKIHRRRLGQQRQAEQ
jgi:hypothetical protein